MPKGFNVLKMSGREGQKIAILASFSGTGGVERMISNLVSGLEALGTRIDLLLVRRDNTSYLHGVSSGVNIIPLKARHNLSALPELLAYIRTARPRAILAAKDRAIFVAAVAKALSLGRLRVVGRLGTTVSVGIEGKPVLARILRKFMMALSYRIIDETICVSRGVAQDLSRITGLPASRFHVVENPVITPKLFLMAQKEVKHPWLKRKDRPVILGMGRLTRQKDFETLIEAFSILRESIPSRLIILGEGRKRPLLERKIEEKGLKDSVSLPGFIPNPYPFLLRADLFVLSSLWEGSPNALTEAMALGVPVVSTDCPSGPREILKGGEFGLLVPMRDPGALAKAMEETLRNPPEKKALMDAVKDYTVERSSKRYLEILLGRPLD